MWCITRGHTNEGGARDPGSAREPAEPSSSRRGRGGGSKLIQSTSPRTFSATALRHGDHDGRVLTATPQRALHHWRGRNTNKPLSTKKTHTPENEKENREWHIRGGIPCTDGAPRPGVVEFGASPRHESANLFPLFVYFPCLFISLVPCLFISLTSHQPQPHRGSDPHPHPDPRSPLPHGTWAPGTGTWHMGTWHMGTWGHGRSI
jgi:hypothetical protein